jgi:3',5'-cyclic AMP phosphodiesterase CpdA
MLVLAHLSDLHIATTPRLSDLMSKRGLGFINWQRKRKFIHRPEVLDAITHDVKLYGADHIAVTGDLVNLSLPDEYARSRTWLETLGPPDSVTVVPGNHDIYVRSARRAAENAWKDYMRADSPGGPVAFPFLRQRGNVALIGLSSAVATGPFMATGTLHRRQLDEFAAMLQQTEGRFRVVLIHHPPASPPRRYLRRLTDAAALRAVLAEHGAELLIHGHDHRRALILLDGPNGTKIPAVGVPSASALQRHGDEDAAGYNVFRIDGAPGAWRCELIARQREADRAIRDAARQMLQ